MPEKLLFVLNPGSGNSNTDWEEEIKANFRDKDYALEFYKLESPPQCDKLKQYVKSSDADKFVAVGGDGTVTLLGGFLAGSDRPLGILPAGSANGMAKELMIGNNPSDALEVLEKGAITPVDTIRINGEHTCIHLADIGVNTQLIKNFEEGGKRGKLGYLKVAFKTLVKKERFDVKLLTKDQEAKRDAVMVVIANAGKYGTGAKINPQGEIDDNMFEAVIVKRLTPGSILRMMSSGKFKPKNIETFKCRSLKIISRKKVHFQVDGEYLGKVKEVTAEIQPHSLNLILPQEYSAPEKKEIP